MNTYRNEIEQFIYEICYRPMWEAAYKFIYEHPYQLDLTYSRIKYPDNGLLEDMMLEYPTNIRISEDTLLFDAVVSCTVTLTVDGYRGMETVETSQWLVISCEAIVEALIIAYGDGRNGKSTFWNAISRVLGLYSGNISADTLTVGCRRNIKPEMAEVKGKRLLIAAEMQEGARLNDSTVKQLCSTDDVFAEKKYKDPLHM